MLVPVQPLIQPLFGGMTELEFLARIAGESQTGSYEIVRRNVSAARTRTGRNFCSMDYAGIAQSSRMSGGRSLQECFERFQRQSGPPCAANLEVIFYRDAKVDDGRYANNGWMQELPDPITKMTWDNAVLVSRKTARELGVAEWRPAWRFRLNGRSVIGPDLDAAGHGGLFARPRAGLRPRKGGTRRQRAWASTPIRFSTENISRPARRSKRPAGRTSWPARSIIGPWKVVRRCARSTLDEYDEAATRRKLCGRRISRRRAADRCNRFIRTRWMRPRRRRCISGAWRLI